MAHIGKKKKRVNNPKKVMPELIPVELPGVPVSIPQRDIEYAPLPAEPPKKVGQDG